MISDSVMPKVLLKFLYLEVTMTPIDEDRVKLEVSR